MKIIPENEVEKAVKKEYKAFLHEEEECEHFEYIFKAGFTFAESRFEELAVEFLNWYKFIDYEKDYLGYTTKELFNQFLKERNGKE
ncbi:MAG TPA: hypothetical protein PLG47_06420 [Candidatus Dojkabacteria bacterium]|nr:hypothetical protein [Candidatus Dojkabacteria bacterium]